MSDSLILPNNPKLNDYQVYIVKMVKQRGFDKESAPEIMMLMVEEVGELAKAIRKSHGLHTDKKSHISAVEEEIADVFIYLLDLANNLDIDLEKAFRDKEAINKKRVWSN